MTVARLAPAHAAPTLASAIGTIRAHGMRISGTRRLLLEALFSSDAPQTAETLAGRLPAADIGSVYRNLERLEAIGLVRHVHRGHGPRLYAVAAGPEPAFVTCERCGAFEAVESARLDGVRALIERELGYTPRFAHFPLVGICAAC